MKYIIKNCPCIDFNLSKCENSSSINGTYVDYCCDVTNCLLKQIVECANICLAPEILDLLEIEEIEE